MPGLLTTGNDPTVVMTLLAQIIDDAGLFPPESLPMHAALARHAAQLATGNPMMTGRFLCPSNRMAECRAALHDRLTLGLICHLEPHAVRGALRAIDEDPRLRLASVEGPLPEDGSALANWNLPQPVYVELLLDGDLVRNLGWLAEHGLRAKVRCGGVRADLFPAPDALAGFLKTCVKTDVPFKATAGLHHAVTNRDSETGLRHFGFLNLVIAVARAVQGAGMRDLEQALKIEKAEPLARELSGLGRGAAQRTRDLFVCFGSCSTTEPVEDVLALGLLGTA